ncbi:MAG: amidohydrolase family protein [SAR202 cluster bacterium]|nr:amidohydrolase family protein [SAR202 cluster bacterium]
MTTLLLENATLLDGTGADPRRGVSVLVEDGRIRSVFADKSKRPKADKTIDLSGRTLMPGLTDAHVHFGALGVNSPRTQSAEDNLTTYVLHVVQNIETALQEGFTTVRDAGGLDPAFAFAVESGAIKGPRILPAGSFISQTGGHADFRNRFDDTPPRLVPGILAGPILADGPDAVRAAAREQLRRGSTQVKLMGSGGVVSPNDPLEGTQYTVEEMLAAVHEARAVGTYVMAHCHTSPAVNNALDAGIRSIEHGSILDEATAKRIVRENAFMVPTIHIIEILAANSAAHGLSHYSILKLERVRSEIPRSVALAAKTGVSLGSGSDYLGKKQSHRGRELVSKAAVLGAPAAIVSATATNARLFNLEDRIGIVKEGMDADLIAVAGDPLADIKVLADPSNVKLVVKSGTIAKNTL